MTISASSLWLTQLKRNHDILHRQVAGVTQAESLLQLPFEGNCLNWVVGHILDGYNLCNVWLGLPVIDGEACQQLYGHGSKPITGPEPAWELDRLLKMLDRDLMQLEAKVACMADAEFERGVDMWMGRIPLIEALVFVLWHISYHTGQLEPLRQLAGKHDQVIQ